MNNALSNYKFSFVPSRRRFEKETLDTYSELTVQLCDIYMFTDCYASKAEADAILHGVNDTANPCTEKLFRQRNKIWQTYDNISEHDLFINAVFEYMLINLDDATRLAISNRADQVFTETYHINFKFTNVLL